VVTDLITGTAVMHHFVVHPVQDPWCFWNSFTCYQILLFQQGSHKQDLG